MATIREKANLKSTSRNQDGEDLVNKFNILVQPANCIFTGHILILLKLPPPPPPLSELFLARSYYLNPIIRFLCPEITINTSHKPVCTIRIDCWHNFCAIAFTQLGANNYRNWLHYITQGLVLVLSTGTWIRKYLWTQFDIFLVLINIIDFDWMWFYELCTKFLNVAYISPKLSFFCIV